MTFIQLSQLGRQWSERKYPIFETVAKGDSNPGSLDCESGILPLSYRVPLVPVAWILVLLCPCSYEVLLGVLRRSIVIKNSWIGRWSIKKSIVEKTKICFQGNIGEVTFVKLYNIIYTYYLINSHWQLCPEAMGNLGSESGRLWLLLNLRQIFFISPMFVSGNNVDCCFDQGKFCFGQCIWTLSQVQACNITEAMAALMDIM